MYPYKRRIQGDFTIPRGVNNMKTEQRERERFEDAGLEDWSNEARSQGRQMDTRSWKRQGKDSLLELSEEVQPCQHLDFGSLASRTLTGQSYVVLRLKVFGNLLKQSQATETEWIRIIQLYLGILVFEIP